MRYKRLKRTVRGLALILGTVLIWNSNDVLAAPSAEGGLSVEVDLYQNGGLLYDKNARSEKKAEITPVNYMEVLPERYDLRESGKVTDVKFQNPWGTCWAFAAVASMESNAMMQGAKTPDYSEKNLVWVSKQAMKEKDASDDQWEGPSVADGSVKEAVYNMGGSSYNIVSALMAWQGASTEDAVPYRNAEGTSETIDLGNGKTVSYYTPDGDWSVDSAHAYDDAYRLDQVSLFLGYDAYTLSGYSKEEIENQILPSINTQVKSWIMDNGAITVSYCANESSPSDLEEGIVNEYYNADTFAQYNPDSSTSNHGVTIVGWDDTFQKENFSITPPGDGAWIIKNSWSNAWGEDGYFYLSYYDTTIFEYDGYVTDQENTGGYRKYDNNYQYDYMGLRSSVNYSAESTFINELSENNDIVSLANVFQAEKDETLRAVGTTDTWAYGDSIEVVTEVYRLQDNTNPVNGELVSRQTDRIDNLLYSVIDLEEPVELEEGEYFSVVQTMINPSQLTGETVFLLPLEFGTEAPVFVEGYEESVSYYLEQKVLCEEGESYIYFSMEEGQEPQWMDLASEEVQEFFSIPLDDGTGKENCVTVGNAMIKAYTADTETTLSLANETLTIICYDADGKEITRLENPDLTGQIRVPWNTAGAALHLSGESTSSLTVSYEGELFSEGDSIPRQIFEGGDGILTLNGTDRGEAASREYVLSLLAEEKRADKTSLMAKLEEAESISGDAYTGESYQALQDAIAKARLVVDDAEALQEEIDAQTDALDAALKALVRKTAGEDSSGNTTNADGGKINGVVHPQIVQTGDSAAPVIPAAAAVVSLLLIAGIILRITKRS